IALDYWHCNPNLHQAVTGPFGWRGGNAVTDRMVAMLNAATRTVSITAFYFKPVPVLMDAVLRAARRGVRVEIFHSHRDALPATELAWIAAAAGYPALLRAGVTIRENRRGEHSKIVLVDDAWAAFGSYNFEDAAHDRLAESMLACRDARVVAPIREIVAGLRADPDTEVVRPGWARALSPRLRGKMACLAPLKRWM
ncbi:MAG: phosphatidylserine/phosphatidylglycerophosphate/cardiolipin synthase family protein, partial [Vicinamibacterales bacterium]